MKERLAQLLDGIATPEQILLALDADDALTSVGFQQHEDVIEQTVASLNGDLSAVYPAIVQDCFMPIFKTCLQEMGVVVEEEALLPDVISVFRWTMAIENFEDQEFINTLANGDEESEDTFADILSAVSAIPAETFLPHIQSVSDALIDRISQLSAGKGPYRQPDPSVYKTAKERTGKLFSWLEANDPEFVAKLDLSAVKMGYPAETILRGLRGTLNFDDPAYVGKYLVFMLHSTDIVSSDIELAAKREIEINTDDVVRGIMASKAVTKLMTQVRNG